MASSSSGDRGPTVPPQGASESIHQSSSSDLRKKPQSRQLLSCIKCRERKVKCDRTKPCSACCARGHPKECEFIVGDGDSYAPIQQSYELKRLRAENQRLKERLIAAKISYSGDEDDDGDSGEHKGSKSSASRAAAAKQRRFKTDDKIANLYFGNPGLANIVHDFANLRVGTQSLTHTMPMPMPKAKDIYSYETHYPFPVFGDWGATQIFQERAQACSFPHMPDEVTRKEVERFLSDAEENAKAYPDMLAFIFAALATGLQLGECDRNSGPWAPGKTNSTTLRADVYLAASMQALRTASFMSQPTLLAIQTLLVIGPYLTNSGRFLDAWTLFGTTIRMAHSIGLHRNPKFLDPAPPLRESMLRRTLWWWMLHMDQHYSVTLGRPLGISGFGDCPPPEPLTTNPTILRLSEFVNHFTILARQILSSDGLMSVAKIDEFTDKLIGLWDTMPEALQWNESWSRADTQLPAWPLEVTSAILYAKVQSFLILLNRQRVERTQNISSENSSPGIMPHPQRPQAFATSAVHELHSSGDPALHPAAIRGRALVVNSSISLLKTFLFFRLRKPAVLICWTIGQQAFNACMILILDAWETGNDHNRWLLDSAYVVFQELHQNRVHKLAELAVQRISDGLAQLGNRKVERQYQAQSSCRQSPRQPPLTLTLDTATMTDWSKDAVMGNTGMFLLEDSGLQSFAPSPFHPLGWYMAGNTQPADPCNTSNPGIPSPIIPVSAVTAAPFPTVASPSFISAAIPVTNSPFAVGLQPRMPAMHRISASSPHPQPISSAHQDQPFSSVSPTAVEHLQSQQMQQDHSRHLMQHQSQHQTQHRQMCPPVHGSHHNHGSYSQHRHNSASGSNTSSGSRQRVHKFDRPPGSSRSAQRRK
ncbi:hypothetical protein M433DRAFT_64551 [Acidomyces richmondensis BFW]|nr:MAG: hypothetical protein FE78DRAFT_140208 [Acidomyces sp. 'richmondensis']KYG46729.1 hypothetical protein M433DRAFT_64551 [Acidomyces richmondensis BFW]